MEALYNLLNLSDSVNLYFDNKAPTLTLDTVLSFRNVNNFMSLVGDLFLSSFSSSFKYLVDGL